MIHNRLYAARLEPGFLLFNKKKAALSGLVEGIF
jgi:hypothetical protein